MPRSPMNKKMGSGPACLGPKFSPGFAPYSVSCELSLWPYLQNKGNDSVYLWVNARVQRDVARVV